MNMNPFKKDKKQVSIFITAGFPKIDSLKNQLIEIQDKGIDFVEIGMPFSDPMADGEVIQESSKVAIENGMNIDLLLSQMEGMKDKISIPIVLMGYFNPIMKFGFESFLIRCKEIGVAALIIPDLSFEIYKKYYEQLVLKHDLPLCFLITPKTDTNRIKEIVKHSKNSFVYLVSKNSTTGQVINFEAETRNYQNIQKHMGEVPLFIGFGIQNKQDVTRVHSVCDGAIIGSAFIKSVLLNKEKEFLMSLKY